jgi:hypothetical protein
VGKKQPAPVATEERFRPDDLLADVVDRHPGAKDVLLSFGLPCFKCIVAYRETLREGCAPLLLNAEEVLARLNALPPHPDELPRSAAAGTPVR